MTDAYVAIVVAVPSEHYAEGDDICVAAGTWIVSILEPHLVAAGHEVPDWVSGGCPEDWGVYFESTLSTDVFDYAICYFPDGDQMMIQYHLKAKYFNDSPDLPAGHVMHDIMKQFGAKFTRSRLLTKAEFDSEY